MLKKIFFLLIISAAVVLMGAKAPRIREISGKKQKFTRIEIVAPESTPVVRFAAGELQKILTGATGRKPAIVKTPGREGLSIVLGDSALSRQAGLDVKKLPDEGYYILRKGKNLYLAGADDPRRSPDRYISGKRGTLSAVYDFLERFAGVRFYFPGEYGTIIPSRGGVYLPERIRIMERPDCAMRTTYLGGKVSWYENSTTLGKGWHLQRLRSRYSEKIHPFCHGLVNLNYTKRFGKSNPEFFALTTEGKRYIHGPRAGFDGQLCFSSGIREQILKDAKSYFAGKSPQSVIGRSYWPSSLASGKSFCVMPQDWMYWCSCEKCRKISPGGRNACYKDPKARQAVSDFMWSFTSEIAEKLTKAGIDCTVNQMAYAPYDMIPNVKLPSNVQVQVAVNGLGGNRPQDKKDVEKMRSWAKKMGHPVMLWTYAQGKHMSKNIPGAPPMMPKHLGRFIDRAKPYFDGAFFEAETDYFLFSYLNYYIISRRLWDLSLDTGKLLDEHYKVMFGKGAPMMKRFYEALEKSWSSEILGNVQMTSIGPVSKVPDSYTIWTKIYSPERIAGYHKLFDHAVRAAAGDRGAVKRIEFIRKNLLGPVEKELNRFSQFQYALDSWKVRLPGKVWLRSNAGTANEVSTSVELARSGKDIVFTYRCEEPFLKDMKLKGRKNGDPKLWQDAGIELLVNPSGDRKDYYQIIINAAGFVTMYRHGHIGKGKVIPATVIKTASTMGNGSYTLTVKVPAAFIGFDGKKEVPINFGRHRALNGHSFKHVYYHWCPIPKAGFHDLRVWGTLTPAKQDLNMAKNGDFSQDLRHWHPWSKGGSERKIDNRNFISGGKSLYFRNKAGNSMNCVQFLDHLKPATRYRFSYFVRCANVKALSPGSGVGSFIYLANGRGMAFPRTHISGTREWSRVTGEFTTPPAGAKKQRASMGLWIWNADGEAWFDHVKIEEIPQKN